MTYRLNASFMQLAVLAASSLSGMPAVAVTYDDRGEHEVVDNLPGEDVVVTNETTLNLSSNMGNGFEIKSITADQASSLRVTGPGYVQNVDLDGVKATFVGARDNPLLIRNDAGPAISIKGTFGNYNLINVSIEGKPATSQDASVLHVDGRKAPIGDGITIRNSSISTSGEARDGSATPGPILLESYYGRLSLNDVEFDTTTSSDRPVIEYDSSRGRGTASYLNMDNVRAITNAGFLSINGPAYVNLRGTTLRSSGLEFREDSGTSTVELSIKDSTLTSAGSRFAGQSLVSFERSPSGSKLYYIVDIQDSEVDGFSASQNGGGLTIKNTRMTPSNEKGPQRILAFEGGTHTVKITDNSHLQVSTKRPDGILFYHAGTQYLQQTLLDIKNSYLEGPGINAKGVVRVNMREGARWKGRIDNFTQMTLAPNSELNLTDQSSIETLINAGSVSLAGGGAVGNVLSVRDYTSEDGSLLLRAQLKDDASLADKLVVSGDTEGTTHLTVANAGGSGAQTLDGIELIHVDGASNGVFLQEGRLVAGAFDYRFEKRGNNWYLNSSLPEPEPKPEPEPERRLRPEPEPEPKPEPEAEAEAELEAKPEPEPEAELEAKPEAEAEAEAEPDPSPDSRRDTRGDLDLVAVPTPTPPPARRPAQHVVRPEAAAYLANQAASSMFLTSLRDRAGARAGAHAGAHAGENRYANTTDDKGHASSLWLRQGGDHTRFNDGTGQTRTRGNSYVVQLGGDLAQLSRNGRDRFHLGVMAGYGNSRSSSRSRVSGHHAKGSVDGYNVGVYGTWYQDATEGTGAYADGQALYNWFDNHVTGDGVPKESYRSKGLLASAEVGYALVVGASRNASHTTRYLLEPYAGLTWMGVSNGGHTERNGTRIQTQGRGNVQSALGLRAYVQNIDESDMGSKRWFRPYAEVSWLHNTKQNDVTMNGTRLTQSGVRDMAEMKLGMLVRLNPKASLWGSIGHRMGESSYGKTTAAAGVSYRF